MGLWSWGDRTTWDYKQSDEAMLEAYQAALAGGCDFFDTAEVYGAGLTGGWGASESHLGQCLRSGGGPAVVASKYMPLPWRLREPSSMLAALRASCDRLGVPAVDLYYVHSSLPSLRSLKVPRGTA
jgi:aryl-alcohol dehydrogenase-like predicted oxidoreductase